MKIEICAVLFPAEQIDDLVQDCSNSSVLAMGLLQSCTKRRDVGLVPLSEES